MLLFNARATLSNKCMKKSMYKNIQSALVFGLLSQPQETEMYVKLHLLLTPGWYEDVLISITLMSTG
jgi:hypothetical protein